MPIWQLTPVAVIVLTKDFFQKCFLARTFVNHFILFIDSTSTVFKVKAWKVLQNFVERLLLVLVALAQSEHLVGAKLSYLVTLEHVILTNPI